MKKTIATAAAVVLSLLFTGPAVAEPTPTEPGPPAAALSEPAVSGPLGSTFPVRTGGDMEITVRPADATVPPREGGSVLAYEIGAEQTAGKPYFLPTLDLRLVTTTGDTLYALPDIADAYPGGFLEPGQPRNGLVAFEVPAEQAPKEIVFATADDTVQGAWTL